PIVAPRRRKPSEGGQRVGRSRPFGRVGRQADRACGAARERYWRDCLLHYGWEKLGPLGSAGWLCVWNRIMHKTGPAQSKALQPWYPCFRILSEMGRKLGLRNRAEGELGHDHPSRTESPRLAQSAGHRSGPGVGAGGAIACGQRLGGMLNYYYREAA